MDPFVLYTSTNCMKTSKAVKLANKVSRSCRLHFKRAFFIVDAFRRPPLSSPRWSAQVMNSLQSAYWSGYSEPYTTNSFFSRSCKVKVLHSTDLKKTQRESIWAVFEANMYDLCVNFVWNSGRVWPISSHTSYKSSSFGWDPEAKRKELFHSLSRFILVHEPDTDTLLAFTMLRFEVEEEEAVVYWQAIHTAFPTYYYFLTMLWCLQSYDVQVTKAAQGMGLGKELLKELAKIGNVYDMEKIMLTVLKGLLNLMFYKAPRNNSSSKHKSDSVL